MSSAASSSGGPRAAARPAPARRRREPATAGSPATCTPMSVPLRDIRCTTDDPATPAAASDAHLAAAIVSVRKKWWLPGHEARDLLPAVRREPGARASAAAGCRSPGCACAARRPSAAPARRAPSTSIGPSRSSSARAAGPRRRGGSAGRSTASSSPTPNQSVSPGPSLSVEKRARAAPGVLDDPDRHRRRADAGHRPDVAVLVPARERDLAVAQQRARRRRGRRPTPRTGTPPRARAAAGRTRAPTRSAGPSAAAPDRARPGEDVARAARPSRPAAGTPSIRSTAAAVGRARRGRRGGPTARSSTRDGRCVAARRRPPVDVDGLGALLAQRLRERLQPDVRRPRAGARRSSVSPLALIDSSDLPTSTLAEVVRGAPGLRAKRDLDAARRRAARARRRRRRADPARRRVPGRCAARRSRPRSLQATRSPPARRPSRPTSPTSAPWAAARSRSSTPWSAPTARTPARPRRPALGGRACTACPIAGGHLTIGARGRAVGVLHGHRARRCARARRAPRRRPARRVLPRGPVPRRRAVLHLAARPPAGAAARRRRGARRGRRGRAVPRRARRVDARRRRARCCRCSSSRGCGATLDLDRLPRPATAPLERWLVTFPSFGFVLAAAPERDRRRRRRRSPTAASPARSAAPSTTRACCDDRERRRTAARCGTSPREPLTGLGGDARRARSPSAGARRRGTARPGRSRAQPSGREEAHVRELDHRDHPLAAELARGATPRSARAPRRASPCRNGGQHGEPVALPQARARRAGTAARRRRSRRPRRRPRAACRDRRRARRGRPPRTCACSTHEHRAAHREVPRALLERAARHAARDRARRRVSGRAELRGPALTPLLLPKDALPRRQPRARLAARAARRRLDVVEPVLGQQRRDRAVDVGRRSRDRAAARPPSACPAPAAAGTTNG